MERLSLLDKKLFGKLSIRVPLEIDNQTSFIPQLTAIMLKARLTNWQGLSKMNLGN
jgi:hypothetical protein